MPDLAIVGAGIMGANHVRTASYLREWRNVVVVDSDEARASAVASAYGFRVSASLENVLGLVDAVIVATPSDTHEQVTRLALAAGKHVLVEKPLTTELASAQRLAECAAASDGKVLVGHVERFNSAVEELIRWSGSAVHLEFRRVGPRGSRVLGDVVSDLMVHDLEIFLAIAGHQNSERSKAADLDVLSMWADVGDDLCSALVRAPSGLTGSFSASRVAQSKDRTISMTGGDVQVVADLVRQSVSIYRIERTEFVDAGGARYRQTGTMEIPYLDSGEPLIREQRHFADMVTGVAEPLVGIADAMGVLELVERVRRGAGPIESVDR